MTFRLGEAAEGARRHRPTYAHSVTRSGRRSPADAREALDDRQRLSSRAVIDVSRALCADCDRYLGRGRGELSPPSTAWNEPDRRSRRRAGSARGRTMRQTPLPIRAAQGPHAAAPRRRTALNPDQSCGSPAPSDDAASSRDRSHDRQDDLGSQQEEGKACHGAHQTESKMAGGRGRESSRTNGHA